MQKVVNNQVKINILLLFFIFSVVFCMGGLTYWLVSSNDQKQIQDKYNYLSKRVLIENPNDIILNFSDLESQLESYAANKLVNKKHSIYFEYLPTGTSVGINEQSELAGASLIKLPLAVNLYKAAEEGKINLDQPITIKEEWLNSAYGELYKKGFGYQLTLRELAKIMLVDSDNTAASAIYATLEGAIPINEQLLSFIDINYDINKDQSISLGSETYSSILKCLYFSCYLNKDSSQEILNLLTESTADNRLLRYLPDDIVVAHKIGTYTPPNSENIQSDCGIFYLKNRNYLLCVMVSGNDDSTDKIIGDISSLVHEFLANPTE
jgi:beta-lactamase class A